MALFAQDALATGSGAELAARPGAVEALELMRTEGVRTGVLAFRAPTDTSTALTVAELVGPVDVWRACPHAAASGCDCRRYPLLLAAAAAAAVPTPRCVVVGPVEMDMMAARRTGAAGLLVPGPETTWAAAAAATAVTPSLLAAAEWVRHRNGWSPPVSALAAGRGGHVLVAIIGTIADVAAAVPAVRAIAAQAARVTTAVPAPLMAASDQLAAVGEVAALPTTPKDARNRSYDEAIVFAPEGRSPLPVALLLRLAGVPRISAISEDYAGSLLDLRWRVPAGTPMAQRVSQLAAAAGYPVEQAGYPVE
jgi:hypothetical protein